MNLVPLAHCLVFSDFFLSDHSQPCMCPFISPFSFHSFHLFKFSLFYLYLLSPHISSPIFSFHSSHLFKLSLFYLYLLSPHISSPIFSPLVSLFFSPLSISSLFCLLPSVSLISSCLQCTLEFLYLLHSVSLLSSSNPFLRYYCRYRPNSP